jgi:hypothetical protein
LGDEVDHGHIAVDFRRRTALDAGFQHGQISWSSRPKRLTMPILRSKRGPFHASQTLCAGPPLLRKHLAQGRQACFANALRRASTASQTLGAGQAGLLRKHFAHGRAGRRAPHTHRSSWPTIPTGHAGLHAGRRAPVSPLVTLACWLACWMGWLAGWPARCLLPLPRMGSHRAGVCDDFLTEGVPPNLGLGPIRSTVPSKPHDQV